MAGRDYGAIVKKDGKLLNWEMNKYPSMIDCVGFSIESLEYTYETSDGDSEFGEQEIDGRYFYYVGDSECVIAFYKDFFTVIIDGTLLSDNVIVRPGEWFAGISSKAIYFENGLRVEMRKIDDGPRMYANFDYKGHFYEVVYGYGIDNTGDGLQFDADDYVVRYVKNFLIN